MAKIDINGVEYEVTEQVAQAYSKERKDSAEKLATVEKVAADKTGEIDKLQAKLDAATEELEKEKAARADAEDPAKLRARIEARVKLEESARKALGDETKFDAETDHQIRLKVCEKVSPNFDFSEKSEEYVQARFDAALEALDNSPNPALEAVGKAAAKVDAADTSSDPEKAARLRMVEASRNAWKTLGKKPEA